MLRTFTTLLALTLTACALSVGPGAGDAAMAPVDAAPRDAPPRADASQPLACTTASDCASQPAGQSVRWCESTSAWSCIAGRCVWDCQSPGRTCTRDATGCVRCTNAPMSAACPGATCVDGLEISRALVEDSTCARPIATEVARCYGPWAELTDGTVCAVTVLPTGARRAAVSCGRCQTIAMW